MPLIKCPDCGREVSDKAKACPGCGRPVKRLPVRKIGLTALISLFAVVVITLSLGKISDKSIDITNADHDTNTQENLVQKNFVDKFISVLKSSDIEYLLSTVPKRTLSAPLFNERPRDGIVASDIGGSLATALASRCMGVLNYSETLPTREESVIISDWAHGIDDKGTYWVMSYVVSKKNQVYLIFFTKEQHSASSKIRNVWEISLNKELQKVNNAP